MRFTVDFTHAATLALALAWISGPGGRAQPGDQGDSGPQDRHHLGRHAHRL